MFLKDKIPVLGALLIFSASSVMAGGPDVTVAPKKEAKTEKAQKSAKKPVNGETTEVAKVVERKAVEKLEVRQHSTGEAAYEPRLVASNVEPERKVNILFESNPTNAELMINGLYVGSTPVQVPLQRGVHNVKIYSTGHDQWERQVKAYKGLRVYAILAEKAELAKP
jgi:hypothetical protein